MTLSDTYNRYYGGFSGQVTALGSPTSTIVAGNPYVITVLGTTTPAQWVTAGVLPSQLTNIINGVGYPQPGLSFIAATSETIPGSPSVNPPAFSGIDHIEVIGDSNQAINPIPAPGVGGQLILQCYFEGTPTAPVNGCVIGLAFYLSDSSILIQGE